MNTRWLKQMLSINLSTSQELLNSSSQLTAQLYTLFFIFVLGGLFNLCGD